MTTERAVTTAALLKVLKLGHTNGQSANTLAHAIDTTPRGVRNLVDELIEEGHPVCAHPKTGYYIVETQAEVDETCEFLKGRAIHGLQKVAHLKTAFAGISDHNAIIDQYEKEGVFA